mgnify:FL=1
MFSWCVDVIQNNSNQQFPPGTAFNNQHIPNNNQQIPEETVYNNTAHNNYGGGILITAVPNDELRKENTLENLKQANNKINTVTNKNR